MMGCAVSKLQVLQLDHDHMEVVHRQALKGDAEGIHLYPSLWHCILSTVPPPVTGTCQVMRTSKTWPNW